MGEANSGLLLHTGKGGLVQRSASFMGTCKNHLESFKQHSSQALTKSESPRVGSGVYLVDSH